MQTEAYCAPVTQKDRAVRARRVGSDRARERVRPGPPTACAASTLISLATTLAPEAAIARAMPLPTPLRAAVTMAILPSTIPLMLVFFLEYSCEGGCPNVERLPEQDKFDVSPRPEAI